MAHTLSTNKLIRSYFTQTREMFGDNLFVSIPQSESDDNPGLTLSEFEESISDCMNCDLWKDRTNFVFGVGNPQTKLVLVGEAPGKEEDLQGEPFVGRAGKLLDKILAAIDLTRDEVYICNILKSRPPENRTPHQDEIDACLPYLETQLKIINPKLIVALGATAAQTLLNVKTPLGKMRSQIWKWNDFNLIATYHPAALLRNSNWKRPTWEDFKWVRKILEK
ncbi:MAG: uracil-DNA glycosylase [Candidatus Marinimicrobia bacterium]|nr:uracil-DNA glycosylase [Candidatus Neomarinimicrobiota bacterium]